MGLVSRKQLCYVSFDYNFCIVRAKTTFNKDRIKFDIKNAKLEETHEKKGKEGIKKEEEIKRDEEIKFLNLKELEKYVEEEKRKIRNRKRAISLSVWILLGIIFLVIYLLLRESILEMLNKRFDDEELVQDIMAFGDFNTIMVLVLIAFFTLLGEFLVRKVNKDDDEEK